MATVPASFRPAVWASMFVDYFSQQPSAIDYCARFDALAAGKGKGESIEIPSLTVTAAAAITPGSFIGSIGSATDVGTQLSLSLLEGLSLPVDPRMDRFNHPDYVQALMRDAARQIRINSNSKFLALAGSEDTQAGVTQQVNVNGGALEDADILAAKKYLDDAEFPVEDRHLWVTPDAENDLMGITEYINVQYGDGQNQHKVRMCRGFEVHQLPTGRFLGQDTPDTTYNCLAMHRSAVACAVAEPWIKLVDQAGEFRSILEVAAIFGLVKTKATGLVRIVR